MKTNKRFNKSPRGFASVATVSTLVVFAAAGAALLEYQNAKLAAQSDVNNIPQATFLAEGALQEAHYYITQVDSNFSGSSPEQSVTIGGKTLGTYDWQVTKSGNVYSVTGTGYIPNKEKAKNSKKTLTSSFTYTYAGVGVLVMDSSSSGAVNNGGNGTLKVYGGKVMINSASSTAMTGSGNALFSAAEFDITGNTSFPTNKIAGTLKTAQPHFNDPLASLAEPTTSGLTIRQSSAYSVGGSTTVTLNPGVYTGGISLSGNANVTLNPGLYYINGGGFSMSGSSVLTGSGVTIFIAGAGGVSMTGNGALTLTAPTSGTYAGVTIMQQRTNTSAATFSGNAKMRVSGTIYLPAAAVSLSGNSQVPNIGSLDIFKTLAISGNGDISINNF